jgi:CDP-diacylglycerol---serine O-phosphatidyltransferase
MRGTGEAQMAFGLATEKKMSDSAESELYQHGTDAHRRLRSRRKRRRAYIRSIYLLPSMATLGNAICGFAAIYIASLDGGRDWITQFFASPEHRYLIPAYLIFAAMFFDAIDGRLARFTRHTTDFGGQLDSMADAISFGVAPAILMLQVCRLLPSFFEYYYAIDLPLFVTRAIWAAAAVYASCAIIRLARFNVSNQHGEQHHYSFLGLPSPAAASVVAATVLMYLALFDEHSPTAQLLAPGTYSKGLRVAMIGTLCVLPAITLAVGLLMVSTIRYPHVVNRYLRGRKSVGQLVVVIVACGAILAAHKYAIAVLTLVYMFWGISTYFMGRFRKHGGAAPAK